jgi:hypothetical protein
MSTNEHERGIAGTVSLVLGILALATPIAGLFIGAVAASIGQGLRRRAMAGRPVDRRQLRLGSIGTLLGLLAVLLNMAAGVVWVICLALRGPA